MATKPKSKPVKHPFKTDYGMTQGHCKTPRGALRCAQQYLLTTGRKHCVIEAPNCTIDVWFNGYWGIHSHVRGKKG
jgi:hypothetical protein